MTILDTIASHFCVSAMPFGPVILQRGVRYSVGMITLGLNEVISCHINQLNQLRILLL